MADIDVYSQLKEIFEGIRDERRMASNTATRIGNAFLALLEYAKSVDKPISGDADTAAKLKTARSIWGQMFDGTADVTGNMTGVGSITPTGTDLKIVGNLLVTGGITMYATDGVSSGIMDAILVDNDTIGINDKGQLYVIKAGGGGTVTAISVNGSRYNPSDGVITLPDYPTSLAWDKINGKPGSLSGYGIKDAYTKKEVDDLLKAQIISNADSATKLQTARNIWGQSFDGTADVSGNMTGVGSITPTGTDLKIVGNLLVTGGITMYATDGVSSGIMDAILVDNDTIGINDKGQLCVLKAGGGGTVTAINFGGTRYTPTDGVITLPVPSHKFADIQNKPTSISGYGITDAYTKTEVDNLLNSHNAASATKLQTARNIWGQMFDGTADVTGDMTNVGTITPSSGDLKIVGNLLVTGGITMYATDGVSSGIMDAILVDNDTIGINNKGQLYVIKAGGGGNGTVTDIIFGGTQYSPVDGVITLPLPSYTFANIQNKPTTLVGYGITDAKIVDGVITLGANSITPLTSHQSLANYYTKSESDGRFQPKGNYLTSHQSASDILAKLKAVDGSGSGLDADTLDGYHNGNLTAQYITLQGFNSLDLSGLNVNTWYPCVIIADPGKGPLKVTFSNTLNTNVPSWSTHSAGFSFQYEFECVGSRWGTIPSYFRVLRYAVAYGGDSCLFGVEEKREMSSYVLYLRGGGNYRYRTTDGTTFTLYTSKTDIGNGCYVEPRTTKLNDGQYFSRLQNYGGAYDSTYAHNIVDSGDGRTLTLAYGKAGLNYGDVTYIAGWNGSELRAVMRDQFLSTAAASSTYVKKSGDTMSGSLTLTEGRNILLRPKNSGYTSGIGYDNAANECVALWAKNSVTRLRWNAGIDMTNLASNTMMSITPDFEISKASGTATGYIGGNTILHTGNTESGASVVGSFTPKSANTYDLGSADYPWRYCVASWFGHYTSAISLGAANGYDIHITAAHNVGIGTTSPNTKFQVNGVIAGYMYSINSNAAAFVFDKPGSYVTGIGSDGTPNTIRFSACGWDGGWVSYAQIWKFYGDIITTGAITINNTAASTFLNSLNILASSLGSGYSNRVWIGRSHTTGDSANIAYWWVGSNSGNNRVSIGFYNNENILSVYNDTQVVVSGNFLSKGGITFYYSSDKRLKKNIREIKDAPQRLLSLGGVYEYNYIEEEVARNNTYSGTHMGMIYQNVKGGVLDRMAFEREDGYGALNYIDPSFISLLAAVEIDHEGRIKKTESKIEIMKKQIKELRANIKRMERRIA